jgi:predicted nucleic acid-binding Zn ribbon protein
MFCPKCGKKFNGDGNFCDSCGQILKQETGNTEIAHDASKPLVSINVSKSQTLVFYNDFLIYKGSRINYRDIDGLSYLLTRTKHSINFIPTHTSNAFHIKLEANGQRYEIGSSATSFMFFESKSQKEKQEIFAQLVYILDNLIKPFVLINLLIRYSKGNKLYLGDSFIVNPKGFYKKRFWQKPDFLPWDQYYNSVLYQGYLYIYKNDVKEKYKPFFSCSMSIMNTAVMPDILNILFQDHGSLNEETVMGLEKRKSEIITSEEQKVAQVFGKGNYCWSCSAPNEMGQKFCMHCGSKLL